MTISKSTSLTTSHNSSPFITAYGKKQHRSVFQISFSGPGRTKQAFKDECDINKIMARYQQTGIDEFAHRHKGQFSDVTGYDFQEAMQTVASAQSLFHELPSSIRTRFENDPGKFLDFVHDPDNASEMHEMGLMRPDYQPPSANAVAVPSEAPVKRSEGPSPNASQEQPPKAEFKP